MSEGAAMREVLQPDQSPLLGTCPARSCRKGKVQSEPGIWRTCSRCHGSGYDTEVPKVKSSPTSAAAGESVKEIAATIRARLLRLLEEHPRGLTDEQQQDFLNLAGNSQRPRRRELEKLGLIRPLGTRSTRSGREARIWTLRRRSDGAA
jgi:hypothetical protein